MNFKQLESFIEVINLRSFSRAAEKLFLTQPAVTNHIQQLEDMLGTVLVHRSGKVVCPTEAGLIFYRYAQDMLNLRSMAKFKLEQYEGRISGHLEIGTLSIAEEYILPQLVKAFLEVYPDVKFTFLHGETNDIIEDVNGGRVCLGFVGDFFDSDKIDFIEMMQDEVVLSVPNNEHYPWPNEHELPLDFLLDQKLILKRLDSSLSRLVDNALKQYDMSLEQLHVLATVHNNKSVNHMVAEGLGVGFVSIRTIEDEVKSGRLKYYRIKGLDMIPKFYFIYNMERCLTPLAEEFKKFVIEYSKK